MRAPLPYCWTVLTNSKSTWNRGNRVVFLDFDYSYQQNCDVEEFQMYQVDLKALNPPPCSLVDQTQQF